MKAGNATQESAKGVTRNSTDPRSGRQLQQGQLSPGGFTQAAYSQTKQPQWPADQFFAPEQKASHSVKIPRFDEWVLSCDLARQRGEIAVTDLYLNRVSGQLLALEFGRD